MRRLAALSFTLFAAEAMGAIAYVSDELVLGVYTEQNGQGQRLTTLHSGARVDTLAVNGDYTQVRLSDGTSGWVKSAYLMAREPASLRLKQPEEELDRNHATSPAQAEAAARNEAMNLRRDLAAKQSELDALRSGAGEVGVSAGSTDGRREGFPGGPESKAVPAGRSGLSWPWPLQLLTVILALGAGFWFGYATLARRVKRKFGGIRVY